VETDELRKLHTDLDSDRDEQIYKQNEIGRTYRCDTMEELYLSEMRLDT
jgi:hypothetical protein